MISADSFQSLILNWFDAHGRKQLPWQQNKTPYRVWISEIMLQQTQVATVIPYYQRFMQQFPDLAALANAHEDEVLHLWAGLGYYSRARNLHRAAKMVMHDFTGEFPNTFDKLITLPGIGQSTAGAILAIAFNQPAAILDGNVKRVLARFHAIRDPLNEKATENKLWKYAQDYTPAQRTADYTQAMMDMGATLCTRAKPQCDKCPLSKDCSAHAQAISHLLPVKKSARILPVRTATFLLLQHNEQILLQKRPSIGIWGGLWSLPEISGDPIKEVIETFCLQHFHTEINEYRLLKSFRHTFSHYHLDIFPVHITLEKAPLMVLEAEQQIWYNREHPKAVGLPKPVQTILRGLK